MNLFTLNEDEHDFLIHSPIPVDETKTNPPGPLPENFDDVVDEMV
ncbi:unnamed protein product [Ectocarpus sp. 12 AP-2014]